MINGKRIKKCEYGGKRVDGCDCGWELCE